MLSYGNLFSTLHPESIQIVHPCGSPSSDASVDFPLAQDNAGNLMMALYEQSDLATYSSHCPDHFPSCPSQPTFYQLFECAKLMRTQGIHVSYFHSLECPLPIHTSFRSQLKCPVFWKAFLKYLPTHPALHEDRSLCFVFCLVFCTSPS